MRSRNISFLNHNGQTLSARLDLPVLPQPRSYAIFSHCFTCNKNLQAAREISRALTAEGIAVLRFDFTGLGQSEGTFAETSFSTNITDLLAAAEFLQQSYDAPSLLIGHSFGGTASIFAAAKLSTIKGIVTIGSPSETDHVGQLFKEAYQEIHSKGEAKVAIAGRVFTITSEFLKDLDTHNTLEVLNELRKSVLIMHAPSDRQVAISHARKLYEAAFHPKSFVSLDRADHILSDKRDAHYAGQVIAAWSNRYIDADPVTIESNHQVVGSLGSEFKFTTHIQAGNHFLIADEPKSVQGDDLGPSPYELLSAALVSCTTMTLRMYADRKKWPLEEVLVHVDHEKIYAEDCDECLKEESTKRSKIDRMHRYIELKGELSDEQRQRMLEIANRCPVHKTLEQKMVIHSSLK